MSTAYYITTSVSYPYEALQFSVIPPSVEIGLPQIVPFTVSLSAYDAGEHVIDLYAQYSRSQQPQDPQNKWSHLVPQWRFLDLSGNIINQITTIDTPISVGSQFVGITGQAQFYYVDDMASKLGIPVILWATLQVSGLCLSSESDNGHNPVPSYANSMVIAYTPYYINGLAPGHLTITRDGIIPLSAGLYWLDHMIPNIITINPNRLCDNGLSGLNILFDIPSSNEAGMAMGEIEKVITTVPLSAQTWVSLDNGTSASYFQKYDNQGFFVGGYVRNMVESEMTTFDTNITASVNIVSSWYDPLKTPYYDLPYYDTPYAWISNPNNDLFHRISYPAVESSIIAAITSWIYSEFVPNNGLINSPYLTARDNLMGLTGFGGIYGIAIDPCYNVWCTDGEMDKIYKFSAMGQLISTIDLGDNSPLSAYVSGGCTPAGISLDSGVGMWVTLFDSTSVFKFDRSNGNLLTAVNLGNHEDQYDTGFGVDMLYKPTLAETDRDNNVWTSYTNSLCSFLYKFDTNGGLLNTIILPTCSNPMDIIVDFNNNIWVSLTQHAGPPYLQGNVIKINTTTNTQISSVTAVHPEYLTMDREGNIWYTFGLNSVGKINTRTYVNTSFNVGSYPTTTWYDSAIQLGFNCLEGIATDSANRIWVINSYENKVYVLSADHIIHSFSLGNSGIDWYIDTDPYFSIQRYALSSEWYKSLQAFGDWTGERWLQKYNRINYAYVTGDSGLFNIDTIQNYDLRKFNESWDATTQIRDYALPETFYQNYNLFENYIGTMIGGLETSANSIARKIYERTANFVANHGDVDTCNIHQLYSLAQEIDVPVDNYDFQFPSDLKRIMDIISIAQRKLWGDRCKCNLNFKSTYNLCDNCNHRHSSNRGSGINTDTYAVSVDVPFVAEYKFARNRYELIIPISGYPLSGSPTDINTIAAPYLLNDPQDYCYYEFIPTPCGVQIEGVINWDDVYTTLDEHISSLEKWYNHNETVEKMLSYWLHEGWGFQDYRG